MDNHEGLLGKYFLQAKEQPSLLSSDEARSILQASESQEHRMRGKGSGSRGIIVTFAIGAAVMATFLALPHTNDSIKSLPESLARGENRTFSAEQARPGSLTATMDQGDAAVKGSLRSTASSSTAPAMQHSVSRNLSNGVTTSPSSAIYLSTNSDIELPTFSYDNLLGDIGEVRNGLAASQSGNVGAVAVADRPALGYRVARANLAALPEVPVVPGKVVVTPLPGLNTPYHDDYNPMVTADGRTLYFISNREHGLGGHDFWVARKKSRQDILFSEPHNLGSGINTSRDEGSASISGDGQTMYFTGCHRPDGLGECDIYEARLQEEGWMEVRNLREINTRYWEAQPTISADGRALYFVSNRPGVIGGREDADILVSYKMADGTWSKPENLGSAINTDEREDSPFIVPGGDALYFSSAGHKGMGGLDFYVSHKGEKGGWLKPQNLGAAFNTPNDERFITLPAAEDVIYFASSDGKGGLNLYMARREASSSSIVLNGKIIHEESGNHLDAHLLFVDGESGEVLAGARTNDETEEFSLVVGESTRDREIFVYGIADSLGEFRAKIFLPSATSYREYRCDFILSKDGSNSSNLSNDWMPGLQVTTGSTADQVAIDLPNGEWGELSILDAWGHRLIQKFVRSDRSEQINLSSAPDGLYLARLGQKTAVIPIDRKHRSADN